jgi:hypothetical protein
MSWFSDNILKNPILNPAGWVMDKVQDSNGGDANTRVANWFALNPPLGCNGTLTGCSFDGTQEDWEAFRRDFIQNCTAANATNFTESTNRTNNACQAAFDEATQSIRFTNYVQNVAEKNFILDKLGKDSPMTYLIIMLFVGLIVYLLMSKSKK